MTEKPTTLSRRAALGALGSAAAAIPAVAFAGPATADPIFELITDHREAMTAYTAAVHATNRLSEVLPDEQQHWFWSAVLRCRLSRRGPPRALSPPTPRT
jgi:hypothetical protein